jgi:hypothetical protein
MTMLYHISYVTHIFSLVMFLADIDHNLLFTPNSEHVLLIRNPMDMILSWDVKSSNHGEDNSSGGDSTGLHSLVQLFIDLRRRTGQIPVVVDVDMMLDNPKHTMKAMSDRLGIPFDLNQLTWPAGAKPDIDGLWASYWYDYVHKTTGFQRTAGPGGPKKAYRRLTPQQLEVYREVLPFYEMLKSYAIGTDAMARGLSHCPKTGTTNFGLQSFPRQNQLIILYTELFEQRLLMMKRNPLLLTTESQFLLLN